MFDMDAKRVRIHKAQPVIQSEPVQDTWIIIQKELPDAPSLEVAQETYTAQGLKLDRALYESLPGGTYHALLVAMLERKHSLLVVSENDVRRAQRPATIANEWDPATVVLGEDKPACSDCYDTGRIVDEDDPTRHGDPCHCAAGWKVSR